MAVMWDFDRTIHIGYQTEHNAYEYSFDIQKW